MTRVAFATLAALALAPALSACEDKPVERLRGIRDAVCACKTSACAEAALKRVPQEQTPSNHRTQQVAREMFDCVARLHRAERPAEGEGP